MDELILDLSFEAISYQTSSILKFREKNKANGVKQILKNVTGEFCSSELSAIIGPSASGKSSLLNILSGYRTGNKNLTGAIKINGSKVPASSLRKLSSYVMQETNLHAFLTVHETLIFAARFRGASSEQIEKILLLLNMTDKRENFVKNLSGGEEKRLAIAVELFEDLPIMFFDEPTTGLDTSSSLQCVRFLKQLALSGKTIVCSIHSPSALLFEMFNHIYALADGSCIYQGSSHNLVPFLSELEINCPANYSPSDFLMEVATNEYGEHNHRLIEKIQNGSNFKYRQTQNNKSNLTILPEQMSRSKNVISFTQQVKLLLQRGFLISLRDKTLYTMRFSVHLIVSVVIGLLSMNVGNEASRVPDNFKFLIATNVSLFTLSFFSLYCTIPLDFPMLKRERFNRWYSATAYFTALNLADIPITFLCCLLYATISYWITNQPYDSSRYLMFSAILLALCYAAQGIGMMGSAYFDIKYAVVFGAFFSAPFIALSMAACLLKDVSEFFHPFFEMNFVDISMKATVMSVYGFNRTKIECREDVVYCFFAHPSTLLNMTGSNVDIESSVAKIAAYAVITRILTFYFLKLRLKT